MLPDIAAKGSRVRRDRCSNLPVKHFVSRVASRLSAMPSGADDPAPPEHRTKHGLREFKDDIVLFFKTAYSYCTREDIWLLCLMILTSYSVRADLSADMKYAVNHQWFYMFATTFFVIAPVVFVGFLTRDWIIDKEDTCGRANYSDIVCGSLYRYWLAIDALRKANNNEDNDTFKQRRSDLQLFVLYMTLLKSAPQAVFQFYVKLDTDGWNTFTGWSAWVSVATASVAILGYHKDVMEHCSGKKQEKLWCLCHGFGRLLTGAPRLIAMAMIGIKRDLTAFLIICHNVVVMLFIILMLRNMKKAPRLSGWKERAEVQLTALACVFCVSNVGDHCKVVMQATYFASTLLNLRLICAYLTDQDNQFSSEKITVIVFAVIELGCIAMCFYKLFEDSSFNTPVPFSRIIHKSEISFQDLECLHLNRDHRHGTYAAVEVQQNPPRPSRTLSHAGASTNPLFVEVPREVMPMNASCSDTLSMTEVETLV
ncbi:XK-related protein 6 isoform X3 [Rhipicephalus microplus]|uniref:XK-related protein 6 isoform X3 n=1 Tax=Rhipicephalus microplus TaxID=6941 RepID=UPI003F6CAB21